MEKRKMKKERKKERVVEYKMFSFKSVTVKI